jgi:hypothetical protein
MWIWFCYIDDVLLKSLRQKSEKNVSKSANKLTTIIVNSQSINSKNEMIWKVIDTRKPEIVVMSCEEEEEEEVCLIRIKRAAFCTCP